MNYIDEQSAFLLDISLLIQFANKNGFQVTSGEFERSPELQLIYFHGKKVIGDGKEFRVVDSRARTTTLKTNHSVRRAADLHFFINKEYIFLWKTKEGKEDIERIKKAMKPIADFWKSLNPTNVWGGDWKSLFDAPHFQRN